MKGARNMTDVVFQKEAAKWINAALRAYKKRSEENKSEGENSPWILFTLKGDDYAVSAKYVTRTAMLYEMVPYEKAPSYCPGVIWDREGIVRLLDLRALMGLGSFMSRLKECEKGLPMLFIINEDFRRGVIVDRILMIRYVGNDSIIEYEELIPYTCGRLRLKSDGKTALIIHPDDFRLLEFDERAARLNWKGRIDILLMAAALHDKDKEK